MLVSLTLFSITGSVSAQTMSLSEKIKQFPAGLIVRVSTPSQSVVGSVARVSNEYLTLTSEVGRDSINLADVEAIYGRSTRSKTGFRTGLVIGGAGGALAGRAYWAGADDDGGAGIPGLILGGIVGAGIGSLLGAMIGDMIPYWQLIWKS